MKTIRNLTIEPVKVPLGPDKVLHLGPRMTGQIGDRALDSPALRRLIESGRIEVVGEGSGATQGSDRGSTLQESSRGHLPDTTVKHRGNR